MAERFKITWRVSDAIWAKDDRSHELMKALLRYGDTADEVAFFIGEPSNSPYDPLERIQKLADIFRLRAKEFRAAGKSVGYNLWPTFGAGESLFRAEKRPTNPFPHMVGMNGAEDATLACPVSDEFLEYSRKKYEIVAKSGPDFIWVDDDTRFTNLSGVPYPCFCPHCVAGFENGRWKSREELVAALNQPENEELRHKWSEYGADRLAHYCTEVRAAVDAVNPSIDMGFMTVGPTHTTFSGDFIEKCMKALRSHRGRPGHGFYWDDAPGGALEKCMEAGWQIVRYPEEATEIHYEEESCPYVYLDKSTQSRLNEVSLALMAGCTGVAYNHLTPNPRADELLRREIEAIHGHRPLWEKFTDFSAGLGWQGFWPAFHEYMAASMDCSDGWFHEDNPAYDITKPLRLGRVGLPLTADRNSACAAVFSGKTVHAFSKDELTKFLSGNVLLDSDALEELTVMGLGTLTGVKPGAKHPCTSERLTGHPFNGPFEAFCHNGLYYPACDLEPLDNKAESLAVSVDGYGTVFGSCMSKYENILGGKVVVLGYNPWQFIEDPHKLWQMRSIAAWMGSPLTIRWPQEMEISQICPYIRSNGKKAAVLLVNASLDDSAPLELLLKGSMTRAAILSENGERIGLKALREGDGICVSVPPIQPWHILTLLAE